MHFEQQSDERGKTPLQINHFNFKIGTVNDCFIGSRFILAQMDINLSSVTAGLANTDNIFV